MKPRKKQKYIELWMNPLNGGMWILFKNFVHEKAHLFWHCWDIENDEWREDSFRLGGIFICELKYEDCRL